ncbi:DEAD/DEAH box helicase [Rhizobium sp. XQZ8]|uniref:DEAD/DEAH box helicase n=1 Tax=Rhizobium populisoli TaxID=2859785 RepID=UPI001CA4A21D|nr:DEAD/DEAH box helicase [Rhizobium populisoli]MBW6425131.1 DEAD/DEAH box helicase [Rhizobium populisoli]
MQADNIAGKKWQVLVSVAESRDENASVPSTAADQTADFKLPPGFVATRLAALLRRSERSLCYVALSEGAAAKIAEAVGALFPEIKLIILPPWDSLPYDRVPPSRHCMGRRMDALRIWSSPSEAPRLFLTSFDATLQRIPPPAVVADSQLELVVGKPFDRGVFSDFVQQTGYVEEGVADDPGELAVREGVIDIYPAGAPGPMRIVLSKDDRISELRGFDRLSQRTESYLESVIIGPASEAISCQAATEVPAPKSDTMERHLLRLYGDMPTVFDILGDADVILAPGAADRLERYLEIIEDARKARKDFGEKDVPSSRSIYLDRAEWERYVSKTSTGAMDLGEGGDLPTDTADADPRSASVKLVQDQLRQGLRVVISGKGKSADALCRRLAKATGLAPRSIDAWNAVREAEPGTLLKLAVDLEQGFVDAAQSVAVIAAADASGRVTRSSTLLAEPELRIGDVVVHEDHGVGILKHLESIAVEGVSREAARLEYRDEGSVLVPMEEFGKLWRYGSEPEAVTLDRLHNDAWQKKREKIAADILSAARHLATVAKHRQASQAERFIPPRAEFSAFTRRFPFTETYDQAEAIQAVLFDLASGHTMNRLVCGDVGFGKTEIALRAAAAVSLAGGQVVVIAPTTVLARQHFATFERRFAATGIAVSMLSRLLKPSEAKHVKAALAAGEIGVVVATQAILAKDVRFARLALLIVDEEHRFGLKDKRAMNTLAPSLHMLTMSATPIPRTLQSAMVGIQEVSLLTTPPSRRRPIRTSLAMFDSASMRTGLMREYRRGGQSFVVVPRIEDIEDVATILRKIVPELSVKVAHGKMPVAAIDEAIVGFAEGDGDVLLATNIIENGLDVPRANTMFVWHADRFGLAQLHQLRGRVGRGAAQGICTLLTEEGAELAEETRLRLSTLVENDRLGSGLAISLRDLDLRGGGDIAGEDQAGHMKAIGTGLYQKLLAEAVAKIRKQSSAIRQCAILHLDVAGTIPADYVSDPAVRLNLYAKLLRASTRREMDDLEEEFEDRFGELPDEVALLLRTTRLQLDAGRLGIAKMEAGPKGLAMTLTPRTPAKVIATLTKKAGAIRRGERLIFEITIESGDEQLRFFERAVVTPRRP